MEWYIAGGVALDMSEPHRPLYLQAMFLDFAVRT